MEIQILTWFLALLVVAAFVAVLGRARIPSRAREAMDRARGSFEVVSNRSLSDDEKERRLRMEAPRLFALLGAIVVGSALALGLPISALWLLDRAGWADLAAVFDVLVRIDFLVAVTGVGALAGWWRSRRAP